MSYPNMEVENKKFLQVKKELARQSELKWLTVETPNGGYIGTFWLTDNLGFVWDTAVRLMNLDTKTVHLKLSVDGVFEEDWMRLEQLEQAYGSVSAIKFAVVGR